eukprot:g26732.t1
MAMGTRMGLSYTCLFVGFVEQSLFRNHTGTIPHFFLRCINAASCSCEELEQFINFTDTFHTALKFIWTTSDTSFSSLDLSICISGNRLITNIHFKPIDSHSYLSYTSSHPPSLKNVFLCLLRICSQDEEFYAMTSQIYSYFGD